MTEILLLNGSPRRGKSNTLKLAEAFCEGLQEGRGSHINRITLSDKKIAPCRGCFSCWTSTPGKCVIRDDMDDLLEEYKKADMIIWSFPLYYFSMPSHIKAFMDRLLPLNQPFIVRSEKGAYAHPSRYDSSRQRQILIATSGFCSRENNFEGLSRQFDILQRHETGDFKPIQILCPEGELFSHPALKGRTDAYLNGVKTAGREVGERGEISIATQKSLEELLYPEDSFLEMANASWDIRGDSTSLGEGSAPDGSERFLRQMAATYNPSSWKKDIIIEFAFTDLGKVYRLFLGSEKCRLIDDFATAYTTRIETPYSVWLDIAEGRRDGAQAIMEKLYKVKGNFETMNRMDEFFRTSSPAAKESQVPGKDRKPSSLNYLLFPWITLWVLLPMTPLGKWGGLAAITLCAVLSFLGLFVELTPYDKTTAFLVPLLGVAVLAGYNSPLLIALSYGLFGMMWLVSCFGDIPLTAYYSSRDYGGGKAYGNPLFMKTNQILTLCWGVLYLLVAVMTLFLLRSSLRPYTGIINQVAPFMMGIFTLWFQRWYPARVARG